jgi:hypothetical protein
MIRGEMMGHSAFRTSAEELKRNSAEGFIDLKAKERKASYFRLQIFSTSALKH